MPSGNLMELLVGMRMGGGIELERDGTYDAELLEDGPALLGGIELGCACWK